jgi:hypothetical protein
MPTETRLRDARGRAGRCQRRIAARVIAQTRDVKLDRTVLPIPEPHYPPSTVLDARDAKASPRFQVKAPVGAPNVLLI